MDNFKLKVIERLKPLIKLIGGAHAPFTHKRVGGHEYFGIQPLLLEGGVFLSRIDGEFTNLLIPGEFTHAAMYVGNQIVEIEGRHIQCPCIIESVGTGVGLTDLITFMTRKDRVVFLKPTFLDPVEMHSAKRCAMSQIGKPYDYAFQPGAKAFYCSELIQFSYQSVVSGQIPFTRLQRLGASTVLPQDFYDAKSKFSVIWDSKHE